jgi:hypothetical protein
VRARFRGPSASLWVLRSQFDVDSFRGMNRYCREHPATAARTLPGAYNRVPPRKRSTVACAPRNSHKRPSNSSNTEAATARGGRESHPNSMGNGPLHESCVSAWVTAPERQRTAPRREAAPQFWPQAPQHGDIQRSEEEISDEIEELHDEPQDGFKLLTVRHRFAGPRICKTAGRCVVRFHQVCTVHDLSLPC